MEVDVSPGFPVPNNTYGLCGCKATFEEAQRLCERGGGRQSRVPPSPVILTVSVDVKQHLKKLRGCVRVEVDVSPGLPVPNSPYGPCGGKATLNSSFTARPNRQRLGVLNSCYTPTCAVLWYGVSAKRFGGGGGGVGVGGGSIFNNEVVLRWQLPPRVYVTVEVAAVSV